MNGLFLAWVVARLALLGQCTEAEEYPAAFPRPQSYVVSGQCVLPSSGGVRTEEDLGQ